MYRSNTMSPPRNSNAQNHFTSNSAQELRILKYYVDSLAEEKRFDCLQKNGFLDTISKCAAEAGANFDKFLADIDRVAKERKYRRGSKEHKAVMYLKKEWRGEIDSIRKCIDCYEFWITREKNKDYLTLVCTTPHLLVFTYESNEEGGRMWPGEVLSVNNKDNTAIIEFFGDYMRACDKFDECFLYSQALETAHKNGIAKYAKNTKIKKQEEYERSFQEAQKYIENIKKKFGSFVPAVTKMTLTEHSQHLIDMYPDAFAKNHTATAIAKSNTLPVDETSNSTIDAFSTEPPTSTVVNRRSARQMISPFSQVYESQGTSAYDSDHFDDDFNGFDDFVIQNAAESLPTSIELPPIDFKIEQVEENYSENNTETNNELRAGEVWENFSEYKAEPNDELQADGEEQPDDDCDPITDVQTLHVIQKRKRNNNAVMEEQASHVAKRASRHSKIVHAAQTIDSDIMIASEFEDNTESMAASSQDQNEPAMSSAITYGHFDAMLDEFSEVSKMIFIFGEQLKKLKEEEDIILAKLDEHKTDANKENFDATINKFREVSVEISKCEEKLARLNAQEATIRAKLNHSN